ncbi:hypothetical protein H2200_007124 [Cladophialophora chaetospira]|uniref:SET domain-containing protein n=1 Tax=Cladophialophora chaetospira TaxID=386627 RepID=A0AA38X7B7_9EURO|nr:hypothetical protein H2200_007124 [Cladophialophora chaetospira]
MEPDESTLNQDVVDSLPESNTPPLRMTATDTAVSEDVFDKHRQLIGWVLDNDGYLEPNAQIAFSARKGYHVVVAEGATLANGTRIASCPMSTTLSVLNALNIHPFSNHGVAFPDAFLRTQCRTGTESLQAFYLMEHLVLGNTSFWAPYIATLPTVEDITAMQFEEEADVMWLEGTNLKGGLSTQTAKWKEMYLQGSGQLRQLGWANALNGSYTWYACRRSSSTTLTYKGTSRPKFRWAATIFGSRSFTSQVLDATLPADCARLNRRKDYEPYDIVKLFSDRFGVLLPLLDLLNHRPGAQVEWQARYNFVGLQILEIYESGQELCNNYGPRDNEGLLLAYGFVIENNPFDHLVISIKAPAGSPLDIARKVWKQDLRSDPERRCFIFDHKHPESTSAVALETSLFSFDLLDSISILCANEREIQSMNTRSQSLFSFCLGKTPKFEDGRIILATLSQLLRECSARATRLRETDPCRAADPNSAKNDSGNAKNADLEHAGAKERSANVAEAESPKIENHTVPIHGREPANSKQRNAKVYRDSQLEIVETAVALCKFVLTKAVSAAFDMERVLLAISNQISEAALENLRTLVSRHSRLTSPGELLDANAMVEMVPNSDRLRKCLSELAQHLAAAGGPPNTSKSQLAVALSALYSEYSQGVKLPHRVAEWIKQLEAWYPPDPTTWAYVPTSGPWALGEEPPPELSSLLTARATLSPTLSPTESAVKRWLRPENICWGWNVMEEERVPVPTSVAEPDAVGADLETTSTMIYWQRY